MKHLKILALNFCFLTFCNFLTADIPVEMLIHQEVQDKVVKTRPWKEIVEYAAEYLPTEGKLIVRPDGYTYLKVDNNYIYKLFPMLGLEEYGFKEPPFFRTKRSTGAHISVFYANEHVIPKEVGQYFRFDLEQIMVVKPSENISYVVLQVTSPELEKLRKKYGLSPKLLGHDFHISLGKKIIHDD